LFHDSAACILRDGVLIAAVQEERFSRLKHDPSIPKNAFRYCLEQTGLSISDIDCVAYYENPSQKLERQIWMALPNLSEELCVRLWRKAKQPVIGIREVFGYEGPIETVGHHEAHAASAFYFSGFDEAAVLTVDGVGEWATTSYRRGFGNNIELLEEVHFPHSIGLLYSTLTSYLGFSVNDGEYKVMGLAPYGKPQYVDHIRKLIQLEAGGQYRLQTECFDFSSATRMYTDALVELLGQSARKPEAEITQFHKDVARSLQSVLEEILLAAADHLHRETGSENLCMAGGVALNCVANGRILRDGPFRRLFVQPAAGDAGASIGAAAIAHVRLTGQRPRQKLMPHAYLGPEFSAQEIARLLSETPLNAEDYRGREPELLEAVVERLVSGKVIGWFQGRMEFGPRALGARSILADPRDHTMRDRINTMVKKREEFRPFAPATLQARAGEYFELDHASPFMLETCQVKNPTGLPAVTHIDGSARVQTVDEQTNPRFARLIDLFGQRTGWPILLNTSFNMRDEPIVCNPVDALVCFTRSDIDTLVLEDFLIDRSGLSILWQNLFSRVGQTSESIVSGAVYTMT